MKGECTNVLILLRIIKYILYTTKIDRYFESSIKVEESNQIRK